MPYPASEREDAVEAHGDLGRDGPSIAALDEPGAVEAIQRVSDPGLQLAPPGVERPPDLPLGERALAIVGTCDQAVEHGAVVVVLALGGGVKRLRDLVKVDRRVRSGRQIALAVDEPGRTEPREAGGDIAGCAYHPGDLAFGPRPLPVKVEHELKDGLVEGDMRLRFG